MNRRRNYPISTLVSLSLGALLVLGTAHAQESLDQLHKKALQEGGSLTFYGTLAQINAEKVLPAFEKRFPGLKVNHVDATADKLIARAITEARGGKTFVDVFQLNLENLGQANDQGLLVDRLPPDSADYPAKLKGSYYVATDLHFIIAACNTNLLKKRRRTETI
jgi:ABC-type glycerol-3-phosphate transport system substrate-binding protein